VRWTNHGERVVYESEWMRLALADIEIPGHRRFDHEVLRFPSDAAGAVIHDPARGILMLWRHRFPTDSWGYEIPAGRMDHGEDAIGCAAREAEEETGWRPGPLVHVVSYAPSTGISDQVFHVFAASKATHLGEPTDVTESERIEWVPVGELGALLRAGKIVDGMTVAGLGCYLAFGPS
jgi:8-oxo-dGTP pyrophosphatase MutT (NUDIX family)